MGRGRGASESVCLSDFFVGETAACVSNRYAPSAVLKTPKTRRGYPGLLRGRAHMDIQREMRINSPTPAWRGNRLARPVGCRCGSDATLLKHQPPSPAPVPGTAPTRRVPADTHTASDGSAVRHAGPAIQ